MWPFKKTEETFVIEKPVEPEFDFSNLDTDTSMSGLFHYVSVARYERQIQRAIEEDIELNGE